MEPGDFAIEFGEGVVAGEELGGGVDQDLDVAQFVRELGGTAGAGGEGEIPGGGDDLLQAFDLPGGGGDVADGEAAGAVDGFVDGEEFGDEGFVVVALFGADTRLVGRDEVLESFGVFAVLDGVAAGGGFPLDRRGHATSLHSRG